MRLVGNNGTGSDTRTGRVLEKTKFLKQILLSSYSWEVLRKLPPPPHLRCGSCWGKAWGASLGFSCWLPVLSCLDALRGCPQRACSRCVSIKCGGVWGSGRPARGAASSEGGKGPHRPPDHRQTSGWSSCGQSLVRSRPPSFRWNVLLCSVLQAACHDKRRLRRLRIVRLSGNALAWMQVPGAGPARGLSPVHRVLASRASCRHACPRTPPWVP